jgi:type IX secretion system PorP/SprF family membrane protein
MALRSIEVTFILKNEPVRRKNKSLIMKLFINILAAMTLTLGSLSISAQQLPAFTHYMYNMLSVNPAYAGSRDALTVTALHRSQWVGFEGAPVTQTLTVHTPLENEHIGLGLSVVNDKIGPTNNTSAFLYYSYIMRLTSKSKLAFGLGAGLNMFQANFDNLNLDMPVDPTFQNNFSNYMTPNFGLGVYYSRERFYAGISSPYLVENKYSTLNQVDQITVLGNERRQYYVIAGTILRLTESLALKPTTLIKVTQAAPIQADITASFIFMKKFILGGMWRTGDSMGVLVGLDITEQLHFGYSYDFSYGLTTTVYNQGTHEIMLRYDFIFSNKRQIHSPRYF